MIEVGDNVYDISEAHENNVAATDVIGGVSDSENLCESRPESTAVSIENLFRMVC
jgi:hypothetical protein